MMYRITGAVPKHFYFLRKKENENYRAPHELTRIKQRI